MKMGILWTRKSKYEFLFSVGMYFYFKFNSCILWGKIWLMKDMEDIKIMMEDIWLTKEPNLCECFISLRNILENKNFRSIIWTTGMSYTFISHGLIISRGRYCSYSKEELCASEYFPFSWNPYWHYVWPE